MANEVFFMVTETGKGPLFIKVSDVVEFSDNRVFVIQDIKELHGGAHKNIKVKETAEEIFCKMDWQIRLQTERERS
jgi:hypothetical protein